MRTENSQVFRVFNPQIYIGAGFALLSGILTFAVMEINYAFLFRPKPTNNYYDAMFVATMSSIPITEVILYCLLLDSTINAYTIFKFILPMVTGILLILGNAYASGSVWVAWSIIVALISYRQLRVKSFEFTPKCKRRQIEGFYTAFTLIISGAFIYFMIWQPWSGDVESFIRWHPYSSKIEFVWRGIYGAYTLMLLWTILEDPVKHKDFILFVGVSGLLHATVMLILNILADIGGYRNGNREHLYGDILVWYIISFVNLVAFKSLYIKRLTANDYDDLEDTLSDPL
mmetsp:Transcript_24931/g.25148  ORF Transcript_24931/g.25148 Transcript_24931/m.25148 type:complete len:287 (+) Transcript_24931:97-957(+)